MKRVQRLLFALLAIFILSSCGGDKNATDKSIEKPAFSSEYNPAADPEADLKYAITLAEKSDKRILMIAGGDWCPWCRAFDGFLHKDHPKVGQYLNDNFILLKVFYGPNKYNLKFFSKLPRLVATPHLYILESNGVMLHSQPSEVLEKGKSYDSIKVMSFLQKWKKRN